MCMVCGCGQADVVQDADAQARAPRVEHGRHLHYGAGAAGVSVPGMSEARVIQLEADVLGENSRIAARSAEFRCFR